MNAFYEGWFTIFHSSSLSVCVPLSNRILALTYFPLNSFVSWVWVFWYLLLCSYLSVNTVPLHWALLVLFCLVFRQHFPSPCVRMSFYVCENKVCFPRHYYSCQNCLDVFEHDDTLHHIIDILHLQRKQVVLFDLESRKTFISLYYDVTTYNSLSFRFVMFLLLLHCFALVTLSAIIVAMYKM